jgi:hypothetical protein
MIHQALAVKPGVMPVLFPVKLLFVRMSIYQGAAKCHVREIPAVDIGGFYKTINGQTITKLSLMTVKADTAHAELNRSIICDEESQLEEAISLLHESLREGAGKQVIEAQRLCDIARQDGLEVTRRVFVE